MLRAIKTLLRGADVEITCCHADVWPPAWSKFGLPAVAWRDRFTTEQYERARTWETVCGLQEMSEARCPTCPHVRLLDGSSVRPSMRHPHKTRKVRP